MLHLALTSPLSVLQSKNRLWELGGRFYLHKKKLEIWFGKGIVKEFSAKLKFGKLEGNFCLNPNLRSKINQKWKKRNYGKRQPDQKSIFRNIWVNARKNKSDLSVVFLGGRNEAELWKLDLAARWKFFRAGKLDLAVLAKAFNCFSFRFQVMPCLYLWCSRAMNRLCYFQEILAGTSNKQTFFFHSQK